MINFKNKLEKILEQEKYFFSTEANFNSIVISRILFLFATVIEEAKPTKMATIKEPSSVYTTFSNGWIKKCNEVLDQYEANLLEIMGEEKI